MSDTWVLQCKAVTKSFHDAADWVHVLKGVDFALERAERAMLLGNSGAGKSTLLQILGGLDKPTTGEVFIDGESVGGLSAKRVGRLRNEKLGFVYQFHHLLPELSAEDNVAMPLLIRGEAPKACRAKAKQILTDVDLGDRRSHKPSQLSGGERQRVALARAMVTRPAVLLADEPTGNLDVHMAERVKKQLVMLNQKYETAMLIVTHDLTFKYWVDRVLHMEDGTIGPAVEGVMPL